MLATALVEKDAGGAPVPAAHVSNRIDLGNEGVRMVSIATADLCPVDAVVAPADDSPDKGRADRGCREPVHACLLPKHSQSAETATSLATGAEITKHHVSVFSQGLASRAGLVLRDCLACCWGWAAR
jgi:hypothetical protein